MLLMQNAVPLADGRFRCSHVLGFLQFSDQISPTQALTPHTPHSAAYAPSHTSSPTPHTHEELQGCKPC